jgi:DNA ligase-associated metallophosphoesterase
VTALLKTKRTTDETEVAGVHAQLDLSGALYLSEERVLLVADLHLEKGSSLARRGMFLPPYDTRETLMTLREVVARFDPQAVMALGDSFHVVDGPERLGTEERDMLAAVQAGRDWLWITGNHDNELPPSIGGSVVTELKLGNLVLRHEPLAGAAGEIAGHLHPVGKVAMRGRSVRRRCFVVDGNRCVMPAFGALAGGLNACDVAFKPLFPNGFTAHLIGTGRIYAIGRGMLCRD